MPRCSSRKYINASRGGEGVTLSESELASASFFCVAYPSRIIRVEVKRDDIVAQDPRIGIFTVFVSSHTAVVYPF